MSRKKSPDRIIGCCAGAAMGGALSWLILNTIGVPFSGMTVFLSALAAGTVFFQPLTLITWVPAVVIAMLKSGTPLWTAPELPGIAGICEANPGLCTVLLIFVIGLAACNFATLEGGAYPALVAGGAMLLIYWFAKKQFVLWPALILTGIPLFLLSYTEERPVRLRALPAVLACMLAVWLFVPAAGTTWQPMEDAAKSVRDLISQYLHFTGPRTSYSIAADGMQPMGDRLGGPADPSETPVMFVATEQSCLLRGSIQMTYTGHSWVDDSAGSRYVYIDPLRASYRDKLFAGNAKAADAPSRPLTVGVEFASGGSATLFVPEVLEGLSIPVSTAVYFNDTGELFLTRDAEPGDAYTAQGRVWMHTEELAAFLDACALKDDPRYDAIRAQYTALPDGIEDGVRRLVKSTVTDAKTPYEAACLLQEMLGNGTYRYTLNAAYPDPHRDFVSCFLLDTKEGYCSYFASALAVMGRMVGLPTRYIQGYSVKADASGTTLVTSKDAHAWVEIYFRGAGWIAFDPTPGRTGSEGNDPAANDRQGPEFTPDDMPTPRPDAGPTPEPELPPESEPTPEPELPTENEPTPEPELPPESEPTSEPEFTEDTSVDGDERPASSSFTWLWWLLIPAAAALLLLRDRSVRIERIAERQKENGERLMVYYAGVLAIERAKGNHLQNGESARAFAQRCAPDGSLDTVTELVERYVYGGFAPDERDLASLGQLLQKRLHSMPLPARLRFNADRLLHGVGSWKQIP